MADNSAIEWTTHTFNPWWGCARVSPGCRFCYADGVAKRYGHEVWRRKGERRVLSDANWRRPLKWNRDAEREGVRARVFCASMADVFEDHPALPEPRARLWPLIEATPWLDWQLLTKRPEEVAGMVPWGSDWPVNVWLGTSVEDQRRADERIPILLGLPARVRFLSCEPLLDPVDLSRWLNTPLVCGCGQAPDGATPGPWGCSAACMEHEPSGIDWVIVGGESGPKARPMRYEWARLIRDECRAARVPFLFKQWGETAPLGQLPEHTLASWEIRNGPGFPPETLCRVGKKAAGRELDGRTHDEYPAVMSS